MTIVVTGASGFLGRRVLACCNARNDDVVGVSIDDDAIATIRTLEPDAVIHLAAVNPGLGDATAMRVANVDLTHAVAAAAAARRARMVHVSTDVVHDGTAAPYTDDARPHPFGDYARSKAEGEAAVLATDPTAVAVRTSLLWDPAEADRWVEEMAIALAAPRAVTLWSDQYRQPTVATDLAAALVRLATDPQLATVRGPLNLTGADVMRRSEFGRMLLDHFDVPGQRGSARSARATRRATRPPPRLHTLRTPSVSRSAVRLQCSASARLFEPQRAPQGHRAREQSGASSAGYFSVDGVASPVECAVCVAGRRHDDEAPLQVQVLAGAGDRVGGAAGGV